MSDKQPPTLMEVESALAALIRRQDEARRRINDEMDALREQTRAVQMQIFEMLLAQRSGEPSES